MTDLSSYKHKYDLHVHTSPVSMCADFAPEEVVDKYCSLGFSGIVITNHFSRSVLRDFKTKEAFLEFYLADYTKTKEYGAVKGLDVLLGLEMRFPENDNDYLVYGVNEEEAYRAYDYIFTDYETFYREFKTDKNLIVQAHPFRNSCILQKLDLLDGIEVFNMHPNHNSRVAVAAKLAHDNPRLLITGGSDFHHDGHQGLCASCTKEKLADSFMLSEVIKSRDFIFDICGHKIVF